MGEREDFAPGEPLRRYRNAWIGSSLLTALAISGCGSIHEPVTLPQIKPLDERTILEFRTEDQQVRLHGVTFTSDSLDGIPWLKHLNCTACRVRYAYADISQARVVHPGSALRIVLPVVVVVGFVVFLFRSSLSGT
jgi:hypothetical protein